MIPLAEAPPATRAIAPAGVLAALGRWARPRRGFALMFGAVVWAVWLLSVAGGRGALDLAGNVKGADFIEFYTAGRLISHGEGARLYNFELQERVEHDLTAPAAWSGLHSFIYPPFVALAFAPLAALPYAAAYLLWTAIGLALLGLTLRTGLGPSWRPAVRWALAFVPVFSTISFGQNSFVSLFILAATYGLLRRGRDAAAGLVLGALLFKPQLLAIPALLLLLAGRWRVLAGVVTTALALLAVSWLANDAALASYVDLARRLPAITAARDPMWKVHSWFGFFTLLLPGHLSLVAVLTAVAGVATLAVVRAIQPPWSRAALPHWFAAMLFGVVLVNPHLMVYDLSLLVLVGLLLPSDIFADDRSFGAIAAIWFGTALSEPIALITRPILGVAFQFSVPLIALGGWVLLRDPRWVPRVASGPGVDLYW